MTYKFKSAKEISGEMSLLLGLVAPSGGGKTYSALRLATGMQSVVGGKIAVIDTENKRSLHYKSRFDFMHCDMQPPFGSLNYLEAIKDASAAGAKIIIVDSMSHEHEGEGGYLDYQEQELQRMAGTDYARRERMKFTAWIQPSAKRTKLVNGILRSNCFIIFCFRAKPKMKMVKNDKGKIAPLERGWQAIAGESLVFEMVDRCLLTPNCNGLPDWSAEAMKNGVPKFTEDHKQIFTPQQVLDESVGERLALWATSGAAKPKEPPAEYHEALAAAKLGSVAFSDWWNGEGRDKREAVRPYMAEFQAASKKANNEIAAPQEPQQEEPPADEEPQEVEPF